MCPVWETEGGVEPRLADCSVVGSLSYLQKKTPDMKQARRQLVLAEKLPIDAVQALGIAFRFEYDGTAI